MAIGQLLNRPYPPTRTQTERLRVVCTMHRAQERHLLQGPPRVGDHTNAAHAQWHNMCSFSLLLLLLRIFVVHGRGVAVHLAVAGRYSVHSPRPLGRERDPMEITPRPPCVAQAFEAITLHSRVHDEHGDVRAIVLSKLGRKSRAPTHTFAARSPDNFHKVLTHQVLSPHLGQVLCPRLRPVWRVFKLTASNALSRTRCLFQCSEKKQYAGRGPACVSSHVIYRWRHRYDALSSWKCTCH